MLDERVLSSIAKQMMSGAAAHVDGKRVPVRRTSSNRLRTVAFAIAGHEYQAIEQNPEKPSRWGKLARDGHQVVQFKDVASNKFIGVAVDGTVMLYHRS